MTLTHLSYSQFNTYTRCPRSWYLDKIRQGEPLQTWYVPIGTAVHQMIERWLYDTGPGACFGNGDLPSAEEFFFPLIEKQLKIEPDMGKWLSGGSREDPCVEDKALQRVKDCFEKALEFLDEIDVWEVEYNASGRLPGLDVELKAFVDIIGERKKHGPVIVDWKTGSYRDVFQLQTYAALLAGTEYGRPDDGWTGLWGMLAPSSAKARPISLADVDPAEVGAKYQEVYEKMQAKLYQTNQDFKCKFCFQLPNCKLLSGLNARTMHYDKADEDGFPF